MMTKKYICLLAFLFCALLTSCVKEDYTGCVWVQPLRLAFSYDAEGEGALTSDDISSAHVYMFNEAGLFVASWTIPNPDLNKTYDFELETEPGKYEFVVWFNPDDPYYTTPTFGDFVPGVTRKDEAQFALAIPSDAHVRTTIPHLAHGTLCDAMILGAGEHLFTIPVVKQSNTVRLTVKGLLATTDTYGFSITDNNGTYAYDCSHASCETFTYITQCTTNSFTRSTGNLYASLNVLKLGADRSPQIRFTNQTSGQELFPGNSGLSANLIDLIRANYSAGIDFDRRHLYDITLTFDEADMSVTVEVDVWDEIKDDYEIWE